MSGVHLCDHVLPLLLTAVAPKLTAVSSEPADVSTHILWISAVLAVLSVILAVYIFRYCGRKTNSYVVTDRK